MAVSNFTQTSMNTVGSAFVAYSQPPFQIEKISCWLDGFSTAEPLSLLGKRVRLGELLQADYDDDRGPVEESFVYEAKVLAVHVGSADDGIETSLLLKEDGFEPDYVDIGRLTLLKVLA
jgi:hypothetical protein